MDRTERLRQLLEEAASASAAALDELLAVVRAFLEERGEAERLTRAPPTRAKPAVPKGLVDGVSLPEGKFPGCFGIVGASPAMRKVFDLLAKLIPTDLPVLIEGESGTGKELVARALHHEGPRKTHPMLAENCAAIPENLLESELFGHVKGAFTGAVKDREGHFRSANRGTLFLDEIGDMPLGLQSKLLRVLQDGEVRPVGGSKTFHVDVRVVAATNKNLEKLVAQGGFREDLFFRLNVLRVHLPPLRERDGDVAILAGLFIRRFAAETKREVELTADALERLAAHRWPGNVRELENELRRAVALCDGRIGPEDLSPQLGP